jgi:gamma-glutamyltranspeptidase/glutathione hydrolase
MFTSLGGGGFLLVRTAAGAEVVFDFFADTPGRGLPARELEPHFLPITVHFPDADQVFNIGLGSVAVPATLSGLLHGHERLATLPLAEVLAPAVELAREGLALNGHQAYVQGLLTPINTLTAPGRALYTPKGEPLCEGERFANPDLAAFLESLPADRGRDFYQGALARRIARDMHGGGGLVTEADLRAYRVLERAPLVARYRGMRLLTNPPPSRGGWLVARGLELLGRRQVAKLGFGSGEHLCALVSAMVEMENLRLRPASGGTTHVSVCDALGNAASMSLSNGEGSGYLVPGTGIMLNNMLGEEDLHPAGFHASPPGERVASMMSPSILLEGDSVRLILGSGGSKRIRTALLQVISDTVDFGMGIREAVEAPRLHWDGEAVQIEPGFAEASVEAVRESWPANAWSERSLYFGGVHAVDPAQGGAGDPRRAGHATVVEARGA